MQKTDLSQVRYDRDRKLIYRSSPSVSTQDMSPWLDKIALVRTEIHGQLVGQEALVNCLLMGLFSGGHILLEGSLGSGKSTAITALCNCLELESGSVRTYDEFMGKNILIVDEIEHHDLEFRSELKQAMQGEPIAYREEKTYVASPFLVLATTSPLGPKPSSPFSLAEKDHFLLSYAVPYPSLEEETRILRLHQDKKTPSPANSPLLNCQDILEIQRLIRSISLPEVEEQYLLSLTRATRVPEVPHQIDRSYDGGLSVRASVNLALAARTQAFLNAHLEVESSDIDSVLPYVFRHRLELTTKVSEE
jgi:MoxR-like ATPase